MKRKNLIGAIVFIFCIPLIRAQAQTDSVKKFPSIKVGIFAPVYLDSLFGSGNSFRYKQGLPKAYAPGIEFVQGAAVALDSMLLDSADADVTFYDTRSASLPLTTLIKANKLDSLNLIIGAVKDQDYKQLSDFALQKKIPFISAIYPNDGGITDNPYTLIANSTLKAHCEAIYSYLLQNHGTDLIFLCRKKGFQEDRVAGYFKALNEQDGKPLLNIKTINTDTTISLATLKSKLDSNRNCVLIGGSLDETFAATLASGCYYMHEKNYPVTLIGMPNWETFASLKKDDFDGFPVYYTTPYFNAKTDDFSKMLNTAYLKIYKIKPSDYAYKGFEMTYVFLKLLAKYPDSFMQHINNTTEKVFCDYNFRPVSTRKDNAVVDYYENKHLYFVKILNGNTMVAW
ncbi:MAG: hypothetical protein JST86_06430 [Bacteroidetes bacterium]|nr:hypothetical protein [Bacteroidota bacterium]